MEGFLTLLKKLTLGKMEEWLTSCGMVLILVLMMLTVVDVSGRLFRHPLKGNIEISELILLALVVTAISATQRLNQHVGVDILVNRFKRIRRPVYPVVQFFCLFLTEAVFTISLYYCFKNFLRAIEVGDTTAGPLYLDLWPAHLLLCFGLLLMCVRLLIQLIETAKSIRTWSGVSSNG